jgi:outer membrane receptor protein involved in Fe transport
VTFGGTRTKKCTSGIASLLVGYVSQAGLIKSYPFALHNHSIGAYFQDDWKVTPRLTLNLGLRYDVENGRIANNNTQNAFDMAKINPVAGVPGMITFAGVNGVPVTNFDTDKNNIAPRFGFAWRAFGNSNTVIRGGGGVFYSNPNDQGFNQDAVLGWSTNVLLQGVNQDQGAAIYLKKRRHRS